MIHSSHDRINPLQAPERFAEEEGTSLWQDGIYRLKKNKLATASLIYLILQVVVSLGAPFISHWMGMSYEDTDFILGASPPSMQHWFGTDDLGRDIFIRIIYGSRVSLMVGAVATIVSVIIGVTYGAIAGFASQKVDNILMRVLEILYAMPFIFFVIILMVMFGRNIFLLFAALGAIQWLTMARIVRGQILSLKKQEFVLAAKVLGVSEVKILWRHLVPNTLSPIIVYATLTVPQVILEEAFLSFLGLGVQEPMSSWGTLIADGVKGMEVYPWMLFFPCMTLMATLFALNFLGDGLSEAFNPKSK